MERKNIVHLHIPKTGGSTLSSILRRQYSDEEYHRISGPPDANRPALAGRKAFQDLPREKRNKIRCVSGHGGFGLHRSLVGPTTYITMLRDPVKRLISLYHHAHGTTGHYLHEAVQRGDWSVSEFVKKAESSEVANGMVRSILGGADGADRGGDHEITEVDFEKAKRRLDEKFAIVGITGRFNESLALMQRRFGWSNVWYRKRNASKKPIRKKDLNKREMEAISEKNKYDIKIYNIMKNKLDKKLNKVDVDLEAKAFEVKSKAWQMFRSSWVGVYQFIFK